MKSFKSLLGQCLKKIALRSSVSSEYSRLFGENLTSEVARLRSAWLSSKLPMRQRSLVDKQLMAFKAGQRIAVYDVLIGALSSLPEAKHRTSVLEVGCSSGYYSEVFSFSQLSIKYSGCDYSPKFIQLAQQKYPSIDFRVEDAISLGYLDNSFDVVISGCCLLHIPEYEKAIKEAARVASQYVIFHRTPVLLSEETKFYKKLAYGVETIEIHFNEAALIELFDVNGLTLINTINIDEEVDATSGFVVSANRTYVCSKREF